MVIHLFGDGGVKLYNNSKKTLYLWLANL